MNDKNSEVRRAAVEALAAVHAVDDAYPALITLQEFRDGVLTPDKLKTIREQGGLKLDTTLTVIIAIFGA